MDTGIYYFSATGNFLAVTKKISERIDGRIVSIPNIVEGTRIKIEENRIIVIFPAYLAALRSTRPAPGAAYARRYVRSEISQSWITSPYGNIRAKCASPATNGVPKKPFSIGAGRRE
jgi:hypothetical protein